MKHELSLLSFVALSILLGQANADVCAGAQVPDVVVAPVPGPKVPLPARVDPAIANIVVRNISRQPSGAYNFTLSATLRNAGTADYRTAAAQQKVRVLQGTRLMRS